MTSIKPTKLCIWTLILFGSSFAIACSGSSSSSGGSADATTPVTCEMDGTQYNADDSIPAGDGCNTCVCGEDGEINGCTEIACDPKECKPEDCGPQLGVPNQLCPDGVTMAGPGPCALQENGEWAVKAPDGHFYDITPETWEAYQGDRDIDFDPNLRANLTLQQRFAGQSDQLPSDMRIPSMGQIPYLDWLGNEAAVPKLGMMSEREAVTVLQRYMPAWHINLLRARAPACAL